MPILSLIESTNEILKRKLEHFDFSNPPVDPTELARNLSETMISLKGLGLSANQVGLPYRVFVMTGTPILACFNPRIVDSSPELVLMEEGCLSYPDYFVKIKRPAVIRARFTLPNGETITREFHGLTSRIFQHEYDHLEGVNFKDRATYIHKEQAKTLLKKRLREKKK